MAEIVISSVHNGGSVELLLGDTLIVHLPETPTTGFRWAVKSSLASLLTPTGDSFVPGLDSGVGGGGMRYLSFRAFGVGSRELHLVSWREWEGESSAIDHFSILVTVNGFGQKEVLGTLSDSTDDSVAYWQLGKRPKTS